MKMRALHPVAAILALVGAALFVSDATADLYLQLADFDQTAAGGGAVVPNVRSLNGTPLAGVAYSNQFTSNGPPALGEQVRVVAADLLLSSTDSGAVINGIDVGAGQKLTAVFAGNATISTSGGNAVALFSPTGSNIGGQVGFFVSSGGFDADNPDTWGVSAANLVSRFTLKPQEETLIGHPDAFNGVTAAEDTNIFAVNIANPQQFQGTVLFRDVVDPLLINLTSEPNGVPFFDEGIIAVVQEDAVDNILDPETGGGATPLATLNAIAAFLGQPDLPAAAAGEAFATGFGNGSATDFDFDALLANGDLTAQAGFTFAPARQTPVPEPTSIALWTLLLGVVSIWMWRRRT